MSLIMQKEFSNALLQWWKKNKRMFPWRSTRDPYHLLIAEVLLHRTRAEQVAPVYRNFMKQFPTIKDLSSAEKEEVEKLLKPLGLRWRVKLLHKMAEDLSNRFNDRIPSDREELESLPGVSHYIASAVRCFGYGFPDSILDTNTIRILGRVFGVPVSDSSRRSKKFRDLYESLLDRENPRDFNFAMIDLAAILCRPAIPLCDQCPVREMCEYGMFRGN